MGNEKLEKLISRKIELCDLLSELQNSLPYRGETFYGSNTCEYKRHRHILKLEFRVYQNSYDIGEPSKSSYHRKYSEFFELEFENFMRDMIKKIREELNEISEKIKDHV